MKNFILLLGSLCFYVWRAPIYVLLILVMMLSDYFHGLLIEKYRGKRTALLLTGNAVFFDGILLLFFGYGDFVIRIFNYVSGMHWDEMGFPIPLGLTVFTLQTMSYVLDVCRGRVDAQRSFLDYAVFVTMFPQMTGGPIVRYTDVSAALKRRPGEIHRLSRGMKRFCIGLAKKVLLADTIAEVWSEAVGKGPASMSLAMAWLGIAAYGFRLYYTYSGYADMAIGIADCLGFDFPENFRHPFAASSVTDFMERWNISLTNWMREYFYTPLAGENGGALRQTILTFVTWALIGLWYGPNISFLFWGIWMAAFCVLEGLLWGKVQSVLPYLVNWLLAMFVVSIGWVLFALNDMADIQAYYLAMFGMGSAGIADDRFFYLLSEYFPIMAAGVVFALPQIQLVTDRLRESRNVLAMAIYRLGEKTVPALLLLMSFFKLFGEG